MHASGCIPYAITRYVCGSLLLLLCTLIIAIYVHEGTHFGRFSHCCSFLMPRPIVQCVISSLVNFPKEG